ncbi:BTAD domain-containing putative transcriptional regulator [Pseudonocardia nematodicida]|uniref:BTAD domain-containing putative transcriptional regulator n=1 Tax=Pseudonocardia nematodicida TaxID=1206997 RepID=A0ABV1K6Q6_9PSEU
MTPVYRVLGRVRVERGGAELPVGGPRERAVLAKLLLEADRVVSVDRLIDAVWQGRPPASARCQVAICVSKLRKAIGPDVIVTENPGYVIRVTASESDWSLFNRLVAEARVHVAAGARADAAARMREALALWQGVPFADVPGLADDTERLQAVRVDTAEALAEVELELGLHDQVSTDLTALVAEHPLRERARARLMLAHHRAGRRSEALQVYRDGHRALVEQLGIEPGAQLREVHDIVLQGGSAGSAPAPAAPGAPAAPAGEIPSQLPRRPLPFAGREAELAALDDMLADGPDSLGAVVLCGPREMGKSALALHWAHDRTDRFPDGQLHAVLTTEDGGPVPATVVLDRFLRALGVRDIPADPAEKTALYRSTVARRRLLVVLDGAVDESQIAPLVPGGPHTRLIVTSRDPLEEFVIRSGADQLPVGPLHHEDSLELLSLLLGGDWSRTNPREAVRIARKAQGQPLPLRRSAARLRRPAVALPRPAAVPA